MTDRSVRVFTDLIGQELRKAVCGARSYVTIVSPYITKAALDQLLEGVDPSVAISIVTRWKIRDVALGVSQPSILDSLGCFAHSRVVLHQNLHAKIYVVDDDIAFVGSANVTAAGLGFSVASNMETVVRIEPAPTSLLSYLELLMDLGVPATNELRTAVEAAAASLKIELDFEAVEVVPATSDKFEQRDCNLSTFPSFRNPEYLYKCYRRIQDCSSGTERASVLGDLAVLAIPDNLNETDFNAFIAHFLTTNTTLKEFDAFLKEPRRFGEMTEWLKTRFPELRGEHAEAQRQLQTIIRWLRFFLPARYRLDQPKYTEVFYRVD
jgi:hypothetical protein